jgi:hypothetical protein
MQQPSEDDATHKKRVPEWGGVITTSVLIATALVYRPAALQVLRSGFATPGFQVLLVMADPYGCPFLPAFRPDFPGRSVLQAPVTFPGGFVTSFS